MRGFYLGIELSGEHRLVLRERTGEVLIWEGVTTIGRAWWDVGCARTCGRQGLWGAQWELVDRAIRHETANDEAEQTMSVYRVIDALPKPVALPSPPKPFFATAFGTVMAFVLFAAWIFIR